MVIPFSRSSSLLSSMVVWDISAWFSRKVWVCFNIPSTRVVFPWSTCAIIAMLRMSIPKKSAIALTQLYRTLSKPVIRFILKRTGGDLEAAQQVLQGTFISVLKSFHTFHKKSTYFTWICKIALNKLADYYRDQVHYKSKVFVPSIEQFNLLVDPGISPEEMLTLEELKFQVNKCLNLLPGEYRRLLHFKYYQELSTREICFKLNLTPRSLEGKLYRAKKALSKIYAQSEAGPKSPSGK